MKVITFYNNKGGVAKTTCVFNMAYKLSIDNKVLVIDCDPQLTISHLFLQKYYMKHKGVSLKEAAIHASNYWVDQLKDQNTIINKWCMLADNRRMLNQNDNSGFVSDLTKVETINTNLHFIPSDPRMFMLDERLGTACNQSIPDRSSILVFWDIFELLASVHNFKYILLDLSPSASWCNQNLIMSCNYFFIPLTIDYYCHISINNLSRWFVQMKKLHTKYFVSSKPLPQCSGFLHCRYAMYNNSISSLYANYLPNIDKVIHQLCKVLSDNNMLLLNYVTLYIPDFKTLFSLSQMCNVPVFVLNNDALKSVGIKYYLNNNYQQQIAKVSKVYSDLEHHLGL